MTEIIIAEYINSQDKEDPQYPQPAVDGEMLRFEGLNGELDLAECQQHTPRRVRVSIDRVGRVSADAAANYWLVAEADLPAIEHADVVVEDDSGDPVLDEEGEPQTQPERQPIETVEVTLWALP